MRFEGTADSQLILVLLGGSLLCMISLGVLSLLILCGVVLLLCSLRCYLRRNLPEVKLTSAIKSIFSFGFCTYLVKELPKSFGGPKRGEAFIDIELLPLSSEGRILLSSLLQPGRPMVLNFGSYT